jgi:hypothetical protein
MTRDMNLNSNLSLSGRRCRWVGRRLPLLAGDAPELTGADRRKVERHLIVCPDCRKRQDSLAGALDVLHAAAAAGLEPVLSGPRGTSSLWPALERQIREERHAPRPSPLSQAGAWLDALVEPLRDWSFLRSREDRHLVSTPVLALLLTLLVAAGGVVFWARSQVDASHSAVLALEKRIERPWTRSALDPRPLVLPIPVEPGAVFTPGISTASHFDFDLDHGTPMGPDSRDPAAKPSY